MPKGASEPSAREMVHVRLDGEIVRKIDHLAVDWRVYRNEAVEIVLREGLRVLQDQQRLAV